jgi:hypothetical protein
VPWRRPKISMLSHSTKSVRFASRSFRNLAGHTSASEAPFFTDGESLVYWARVDRSLWRLPERRFILDGGAEVRIGREFGSGSGAFGGLRRSTKAEWMPQAKGDDYEMVSQDSCWRDAGTSTFR